MPNPNPYRQVKSKVFDNDKSHLSEQELWASDGNLDFHRVGKKDRRSGNEIPDNITEERLYRSNLMNLARQRQKMMAEKDYIKNRFIDSQLRKSRRTLEHLLENVDIEQYRRKGHSRVEQLKQKAIHTKLMIFAKNAIGLSIEECKKLTDDELRLRLGIVDLMENKNSRPATMPAEDGTRPFTGRSSIPHGVANHQIGQHRRPHTVGTQVGTPSPYNHMSPRKSIFPTIPKHHDTALRCKSSYNDDNLSYRKKMSAAQISALDSVTKKNQSIIGWQDQRCQDLMLTLTPRYKRKSGLLDINSIILSKDSLSASHPDSNRVVKKTRKELLAMLDSLTDRETEETQSAR